MVGKFDKVAFSFNEEEKVSISWVLFSSLVPAFNDCDHHQSPGVPVLTTMGLNVFKSFLKNNLKNIRTGVTRAGQELPLIGEILTNEAKLPGVNSTRMPINKYINS